MLKASSGPFFSLKAKRAEAAVAAAAAAPFQNLPSASIWPVAKKLTPFE